MSVTAAPVATLRSRSERLRQPLLGAAAVAAATLALHVRDPHVTHSWGVCPLYALTGLYCPGCGGLRGVNDLTDGHLGQAASSNLLMVMAIPFALVAFGRWSYAAWTGRDVRAVPALPQAVKVGLVVLAVAFTVARNLPGSWLAP
jgi:Protein of unknown function (DUF2752)